MDIETQCNSILSLFEISLFHNGVFYIKVVWDVTLCSLVDVHLLEECYLEQ
jgi:hypothetical protein